MSLRRLLPQWKHIADIDRPEEIYLSRLMLIRTPLFGLYLHIIRRPDWAHCQHDHPWSFTTLILRGGYEEEVGDQTFVRRPGYVGHRPRTFEHRIVRLLNGPALTLVFRGPNHESWGFRLRVTGEKIAWQRYTALSQRLRVLWCDDRAEARR